MNLTYLRMDNSVLVVLSNVVINEDMLNFGIERVNP